MRCLTGSQWSFLRMGVMCSQGLVRVSNLAAELWTYCSLSRALLGSPDRTPLEQSRWEVMKE